MNRKVYYRFVLIAESALSIGTTDSIATDNDVVLDGRKLPIIPASSLAGVFKHALSKDVREKAFGMVDGGFSRSSIVKVYDAELADPSTGSVSVRDNVRLKGSDNETEMPEKTAVEGGKFDRQVVDKGARFAGYLEIDGQVDGIDAEQEIERLLSRLNAGELRLGAKTTRGMGLIRLEGGSFEKVSFDDGDVDAWLDFDMFDGACWKAAATVKADALACDDAIFALALNVRGALSIRRYTTALPDELAGEETAPDFMQMALDATGEPIIPGTSWAGAFRARCRQLSGDGELTVRELFGTVKGEARKSRIAFSESIVHGGEWKLVTRNAIDRFTGGTIDNALFTERTHFGGTTKLEIRIKKPQEDDIALIVAAIADLHNGFMAVGGLTSVGHGLFEVEDASLVIAGQQVPSFGQSFRIGQFAAPQIAEIVEIAKPLLREGE